MWVRLLLVISVLISGCLKPPPEVEAQQRSARCYADNDFEACFEECRGALHPQCYQRMALRFDGEQERRMLEAGCEDIDPDACALLALQLQEKPLRQVELYERACTWGSVDGCLSLSELYRLGTGGLEADLEMALEMARRACGLGGDVSCLPAERITQMSRE